MIDCCSLFLFDQIIFYWIFAGHVWDLGLLYRTENGFWKAVSLAAHMVLVNAYYSWKLETLPSLVVTGRSSSGDTFAEGSDITFAEAIKSALCRFFRNDYQQLEAIGAVPDKSGELRRYSVYLPRVEEVKRMRLSSKSSQTQVLASTLHSTLYVPEISNFPYIDFVLFSPKSGVKSPATIQFIQVSLMELAKHEVSKGQGGKLQKCFGLIDGIYLSIYLYLYICVYFYIPSNT
jgi:hypothetical protein